MNEWRRPSVVSIQEDERLHLYAESMRDFAERELEARQTLPFSLRYGKREICFSWAGAMLLAIALCIALMILRKAGVL